MTTLEVRVEDDLVERVKNRFSNQAMDLCILRSRLLRSVTYGRNIFALTSTNGESSFLMTKIMIFFY